MRLLIDDTEYDVNQALDNAKLGDLIKLKVSTMGMLGEGSAGVTVPWTRAKFNQGMSAMAAADTLALGEEALQSDSEFLLAIAAIIWLAKRNNGETLSIDDALARQFDDFQFKFDPADFVQESADPKAPSSEVAASPATEAPTKASTT
ncbi:MAG TPA: hypothetical protein VGM94_15145 [Galbitalea sp.]